MVMARVESAPGYEDFTAELIPGLEFISSPAGEVSILGDPETKEIFVIPSQYVTVDWGTDE